MKKEAEKKLNNARKKGHLCCYAHKMWVLCLTTIVLMNSESTAVLYQCTNTEEEHV